MVRRAVVDQVGLMDENLFFYNDDLDWCRSIRRAGWKIYFLPQARVLHYGGWSSRRKFNRKIFVEGFRGGLYYTRKHYGEWSYQSYRLILILILILILPLFLFHPEKFKAYAEIIQIALQSNIPRVNKL
jgi:GT2 family glycosyltransferase